MAEPGLSALGWHRGVSSYGVEPAFPSAVLDRLRDDEAATRAVARRLLAEVQTIADRCMTIDREEVEVYTSVPDEELRPPTVQGLREGLTALLDLRGPTDAETERNRELGARRARQGLPVEAMMQTYLIATRETVAAWDAEAAAAEVEPRVSLKARDFAWAWGNFTMAIAAKAHRATELELAREDEQRRSRAIRQILSGPQDGAALGEAAVYGVDPDRRYAPLRARAFAGSLNDLERHLMVTGAAERTEPVLYRVAGDVVGITPAIPTCPPGSLVVVGGPVGLSEVSAEHAEVERAFETAISFHAREGVVRPADLHLLPLVVSAAQVGDRLVERHLDAIERRGAYGETLLATLDAFLAHNGRIEPTARELHLHTNGVRHRLDRIRELSGLDPRVIEDLVVLWWALRRRQVAKTRS